MPDTTTDQVAAALAQIRLRVSYVTASAAVGVGAHANARASAADAPRLLKALKAVLGLADEWAAVGPPPGPAAEIERRARAAELREVIASKLLGEEVAVADTGIERIAAERNRQITEEAWTAEHDAAHTDGALARAGACYAWYAATGYRLSPLSSWPWDIRWWKPTDDPVRTLAKAGALIAAEIDRLLAEEASDA